ncbi:uncharacterized protein A4U43_C05F1330 [Asparagus officinalis]|uniref:Uncharacterized protein n=1 Tax=Asparagus officinalis TaxID=4686 RepID=A0A5P1ENI2_ASPOF|nr:uncharacterized protein A4U43_C05F1330 [Asparagus officinalis]
MAQLPLKLPPNFYSTSGASDRCKPSSLSEDPSFRSVLSLFRSPKRKQASGPPSSGRFELIACFSNGNQRPEVESGARDSTAWDRPSDSVGGSSGTRSSKEDRSEIKSNESNAQRVASFVERVMKVMRKDSKSRIWKKPIMMGKRCSKLADEFPYDGCDEETNAVAAAGTVESSRTRDQRVSDCAKWLI